MGGVGEGDEGLARGMQGPRFPASGSTVSDRTRIHRVTGRVLNNRSGVQSVLHVKAIPWMRLVLTIAAGGEASAAFDFVGFLRNPPPIRKVVYLRPAEAFSINGEHPSHPILFEGGIESDTWYQRTLPTPESQQYYQQFGACQGRSRKGEGWLLNAAALAGQGGSVAIGSGVASPSRDSESFLVEIRALGLVSLEPASIVESGDRFTALYRPEDWPANTNRVAVEGRIERNSRGLPSRVVLTGFNPAYRAVTVELSYAESVGDDFPSRIEAELEATDGSRLRIPFCEIRSIEFGQCESRDGYVASMFLPTKRQAEPVTTIHQEGRTLLMWENGVTEIAGGSREGVPIDRNGFPPAAWVALVGFGTVVVGLGWWHGRSKFSGSGFKAGGGAEGRSSRGS